MNANKQDAGGLPSQHGMARRLELAADRIAERAPEDNARLFRDAAQCIQTLFNVKEALQSELCRAAPAGGDDYKAIEAALHDAKMTIETLRAGYARIAEAAGCVDDCGKASAIVLAINALRDESDRKDSATAGSGEVLTDHGVKALDRCCGELRKFIELAEDYDLDEMSVQALQTAIESMELRKSSALLRKLQQGAEPVGTRQQTLRRLAGELEACDPEFTRGIAQSLRGRAYILDAVMTGSASQGQEGGTNG